MCKCFMRVNILIASRDRQCAIKMASLKVCVCAAKADCQGHAYIAIITPAHQTECLLLVCNY